MSCGHGSKNEHCNTYVKNADTMVAGDGRGFVELYAT